MMDSDGISLLYFNKLSTDITGDKMEKRKYQKRRIMEEYSEGNFLYRLLKDKGGPTKKTSCMKDYSVFYKKYKANKYGNKKKIKVEAKSEVE